MSRPLSPYLIGVPHLPEHLLALLDDRARRPLTPAEERECDEHLERLKRLIRDRRDIWEAIPSEVCTESSSNYLLASTSASSR